LSTSTWYSKLWNQIGSIVFGGRNFLITNNMISFKNLSASHGLLKMDLQLKKNLEMTLGVKLLHLFGDNSSKELWG
jgi:hypothetical protein